MKPTKYAASGHCVNWFFEFKECIHARCTLMRHFTVGLRQSLARSLTCHVKLISDKIWMKHERGKHFFELLVNGLIVFTFLIVTGNNAMEKMSRVQRASVICYVIVLPTPTFRHKANLPISRNSIAARAASGHAQAQMSLIDAMMCVDASSSACIRSYLRRMTQLVSYESEDLSSLRFVLRGRVNIHVS